MIDKELIAKAADVMTRSGLHRCMDEETKQLLIDVRKVIHELVFELREKEKPLDSGVPDKDSINIPLT